LKIIYPCDGKAEFSASLLQSSLSRELSKCIAQETDFIFQIEKSCTDIFEDTVIHFLKDSLMSKKSM